MKFITEALGSVKGFCDIKQKQQQNKFPLAVTGLTHIHKCAVIQSMFSKGSLVITAGEPEAERMCEDLKTMGLKVLYFPSREYNLRSGVTASREFEHLRLGTLSNLLEGAFDIVVASVGAVCGVTIPPDELLKRCFKIKVGDTLDLKQTTATLIAGGYKRSEKIDGIGQFSVRGGIIDIFSPNMEIPIRIDLFGDEVDSISSFSVDTQRRLEQIKAIKITPCLESTPISPDFFISAVGEQTKAKKVSQNAKDRMEKDILRLTNGADVAFDAYLNLIYNRRCTLLDYVDNAKSDVFVCDTNNVYDRLDGCLSLQQEDVKLLLEDGGLPCCFSSVYNDSVTFSSDLKKSRTIFLDMFGKNTYPVPLVDSVNLKMTATPVYSGTVSDLCDELNDAGYGLTVLLAGGERAAANLAAELNQNGVSATFAQFPENIATNGETQTNAVFVTTGFLSEGFSIPTVNFNLILCGRPGVEKRKKAKRKGSPIGSLEQLRNGDYVVHASHGIGIFDGIHSITTREITKDYIKIKYQGKDVLYVPVTSLDLVSRYIGSKDDVKVRLNRLGSADWGKTKARTRVAVKNMAKQLTVLYAKRMNQKGFAFSVDTDMQADFERRFQFDETDDQLRCIDEIKTDMQRTVPMDRLLCGDVGFGKTEVALRAAFKCIADGKQCAILVPTTILAWQHYNTALERMGNMAVNIEMISRFRTKKQQEKIKKDLRAGNIDLVIGTHSIISDDVVFKDLGLLITDEEQRFGVGQKERLKEKYPFVDSLTLSATPIPRTLNMALSGLRDMSAIEEAPGNRFPVQTYVLEQDKGVVIEAINKELRRGGQVYYLHNNTADIQSVAAKLLEEIPEAKIAVAHGKMSEEALSKVWQQLTTHEIDVLVCTTIIETGVDIPNANTLIVENADRFGLAQLHQLRGRVGRSNRRSFAYLFYAEGKALTDISQKRLDAIRQFTEFGAGFKIAMRDLEIRGAGSVLGGEQHGHLEAVGYDMYIKLLSDAISEEKGEMVAEQAECLVDVRINAHIPEKYISSLTGRLEAYRRIADVRTEEDLLDINDELLDRYGDIPRQVENLILVSYCKNRAIRRGITEISEQNGSVLLTAQQMGETVAIILSAFKGRVVLQGGAKPKLSVKIKNNSDCLQTFKEIIDAVDVATGDKTMTN